VPHSHGPRGHAHGPRGQGHAHDHTVTGRGLLGMGAAAGMIPCPSALVVLLGALSQHEIALGLLLIAAFSLGLAGTLTALGLAVVYARGLLPRLSAARNGRPGRSAASARPLAAAAPALSALAIVAVGCVLTARALPGLM
jgi:nickel/cobalt exporter